MVEYTSLQDEQQEREEDGFGSEDEGMDPEFDQSQEVSAEKVEYYLVD